MRRLGYATQSARAAVAAVFGFVAAARLRRSGADQGQIDAMTVAAIRCAGIAIASLALAADPAATVGDLQPRPQQTVSIVRVPNDPPMPTRQRKDLN